MQTLRQAFGSGASVLDIGCGAGLLANPLAEEGFRVSGIDLSLSSLTVAQRRDTTKSVQYVRAGAEELPFLSGSFEAVCALDLLEHVDKPQLVIREAARVLRPGGLFFFYTFNRTLLSWLLAIKGVEWFVTNTPKRMHTHGLFLKPSEVQEMCRQVQLQVVSVRGLQPLIWHRSFWKLLLTGHVPEDFTFVFANSLRLGYLGVAKKVTDGSNSV